jgi:hypothetical protein
MTFEEWLEKERPWSQNLHQIEQYKLVWNAAIKAALDTVKERDYFVYQEYGGGMGSTYHLVLPRKHIEDLLTEPPL